MSRSAANRPQRNGTIRCAIYTRKSTEEGLEQEFNSLQAQREACEAFIKSQRHEGWVCLPDGYDDGGLSGATMERPALQQLLAEIQAGRGPRGADIDSKGVVWVSLGSGHLGARYGRANSNSFCPNRRRPGSAH
jgi:Resolvase, N terminal domain